MQLFYIFMIVAVLCLMESLIDMLNELKLWKHVALLPIYAVYFIIFDLVLGISDKSYKDFAQL